MSCLEDVAAIKPQPSQPRFPTLDPVLALTGELGLSPSQYESLRVRPMANGWRVRTSNEPSRFPINLAYRLRLEGRLADRLLVDLGLTPVYSEALNAL